MVTDEICSRDFVSRDFVHAKGAKTLYAKDAKTWRFSWVTLRSLREIRYNMTGVQTANCMPLLYTVATY
jgi:hypothetical protein